jgi:hypothetical protein
MSTSKCKRTDVADWGKLRLEPIVFSGDFWSLYEEMEQDGSVFIHNRPTFLEAYMDGNLYGLLFEENDFMVRNVCRTNNLFVKESFYLLPCFCIRHESTAVIIWTHTRARKLGFARKLVELLKLEFAFNPLPESIKFWEKCDIKITDSL